MLRSNLNIAGVLLLALSSWAAAQTTGEPIRISADEATRSERDGVTRYTGNVVLTQGVITINANTLEIQQAQE